MELFQQTSMPGYKSICYAVNYIKRCYARIVASIIILNSTQVFFLNFAGRFKVKSIQLWPPYE